MSNEEERKLADKYGWQSILDDRRGYQWCKFVRENYTIWETRKGLNLVWGYVRLKNGLYSEHKYYNTLEEAFNKNQE